MKTFGLLLQIEKIKKRQIEKEVFWQTTIFYHFFVSCSFPRSYHCSEKENVQKYFFDIWRKKLSDKKQQKYLKCPKEPKFVKEYPKMSKGFQKYPKTPKSTLKYLILHKSTQQSSTYRYRKFPVSGIFDIFGGIGTGIRKIWYKKKVSESVSKKFVTGNFEGIYGRQQK